MSEPSKLLEKLILSGDTHHGNNPVLSWMAGNVAILHGPNESIRPVKEKSNGRVDGIVALIMGLKRATVAEQQTGPPPRTSGSSKERHDANRNLAGDS